MHVEFLTGSSGSGKSKRLYDILLDMSQENPDKKIFLVVPEQFTMQAQRNIVENTHASWLKTACRYSSCPS